MATEEKEQLNNEEIKDETVPEQAEEETVPEQAEEETVPEPVEGPSPEDGDSPAAPQNDEEESPAEPDWKDKYLRLHADWDNYRKRMDEQRADERARANERLIGDLLPLIDDFKHAIDYAEKNGEGELLDGVKAISTKFFTTLKKNGLQEIDPAGEAFDPLLHQAVGTVEDAESFDETVKDVYQKGYKLGVKVIRPAMVTITTGGKARPKDEETEKVDE